MTPLVLSDVERESLERLRSDQNQALVFRNITVILQTARGSSQAELSRALGGSLATIDRVRRAYRRDGRGGRLPVKPPGRPSHATPEFRAALAEAVPPPPPELGSGFTTGRGPRLAAPRKKLTQVGFSEDQLRRLRPRESFSVPRPKPTLKGKRDAAEFQRARGELEALQKGLSSPRPKRS